MQHVTSANAQNDSPPQLSPSSTSTTSSAAASPTECLNSVRYSTARRDVSESSSRESIRRSCASSVGRQFSSGSISNTDADVEFDEVMAETWSPPMHSGGESHAADQCFTWPTALSSLHVPGSLSGAAVDPYSPLASQPQSSSGTVARRILSNLPHSKNMYDETISSTDSDTLVNPLFHEDAWSESTLQEIILDYYGTGPSRDDTTNHIVPWSKGHLQKLGTHSALDRYQAEDPGEAPMTIFSLRTYGTTCAFCGYVFTGPDHEKMSIDHTSKMHIPTQQNPMIAKKRPMIHPRRLSEFSDAATMQTSLGPSSSLGATDPIPRRPFNFPLRLASDLNAIGTKWQDELRVRKIAAATIVSTVSSNDNAHLTTSRDPKVLLDRFLALPDTLTSYIDTERLNDFLNGIDLVTRDLLHRFPNNETVRGLQSTITSLGPVLSLNPHPMSSKKVPSTIDTQIGVQSCPAPQHDLPPSGLIPSSDSSTSQHLGESRSQIPKDKDALSAETNEARQGSTTCLQSKRKKLRKRLLACPVKKNSDLHNHTSSCGHTGSDNMSDLRKHIVSRDHRESFPFVLLCRACGEYIINEKLWRKSHITKHCIQQTGVTNKQIRGSGVAEQWSRLYGRMFPQSERIPSPYVDDPTSLPKASSSRLVQPEPSIQNDGLDFNFNDPQSRLPSIQDVSFRQIFATPYPMPAPIGRSSGQTARRAILESTPTDNSLQDHTSEHQLPSSSQPFLDYSVPLTNGLNHTQIPSNGITATELPHIDNQDDGFNFYYPGAMELQNTGLQQQSTPMNTSFHAPGMQLQPQDNTFDRSRTAAQHLVHELLDEVIGNGHRNAEGSTSLAQQISHINGGTWADCEALAIELMIRIHVLAEQRRSHTMTAAGFDASVAAYNPIIPRLSRDGQHFLRSPLLLHDLDLLPLGSSEEDLYNPATLENMGTSFWETQLDPTQRSFFPEIDLTRPAYVPT